MLVATLSNDSPLQTIPLAICASIESFLSPSKKEAHADLDEGFLISDMDIFDEPSDSESPQKDQEYWLRTAADPCEDPVRADAEYTGRQIAEQRAIREEWWAMRWNDTELGNEACSSVITCA